MFRSEGFGVGESVFIVKPNPHCRFRNLNSAGELANRNSSAPARNVNELLKRRVRMKREDEPATRRDSPTRFSLAKQSRHRARTIAPASTKASAIHLSAYQ